MKKSSVCKTDSAHAEILHKQSFVDLLPVKPRPEQVPSGVFRFFAMVRHLLLLSCGVLLQKSNLALLHQLVHQCHPFFRSPTVSTSTIYSIWQCIWASTKRSSRHLRCLGSIAHFQSSNRSQIIRQHPEAQHFILGLTDGYRDASADHGCGSGRFRVKPEVQKPAFALLHNCTQIEQPCHKVVIPFSSAAEAEKIVLIQLQARRMPVVNGTGSKLYHCGSLSASSVRQLA